MKMRGEERGGRRERVFVRVWGEVAGEVHRVAEGKGWWDEPRGFPELVALMHSELSEALEAYRENKTRGDKIPEFSGQSAELADVVIRIMDVDARLGLGVGKAIIAKMKFNEGRAWRHGGKKC